MKIVFIAHPIGGDVAGNLKKIVKIGREINLTEPYSVPFAPHFFDCHCLKDEIPSERFRGIQNGHHLLRLVDELRLYGDRISPGMLKEIELCHEWDIPVIPMTKQTKEEYEKIFLSI